MVFVDAYEKAKVADPMFNKGFSWNFCCLI